MVRRIATLSAPILVSCVLSMASAGCETAPPAAGPAVEAEMQAHLDSRIEQHLKRIRAQLNGSSVALR
ncbi:MAG: hypothetical protein HY904_25495 [Deltaproteobacteria bacterium]|nr:hypothetical protein [Deltaproteobacteria bacterium]